MRKLRVLDLCIEMSTGLADNDVAAVRQCRQVRE